ncbi:MAG: aminodeoxychorismate lyase [Proteobacteria bacterium]|nr:MAG: aminodeoxychorismate lyase [Pseudomonadota bacterium]
MSAAALVNGAAPDAAHAIALDDRGLNYGDGLFETARVRDGQVPLLEDHLERLRGGCARLGIPMPDADVLRGEIARVIGAARDGVLKIVVTRGAGGRGYRPAADLAPTRIVALHPLPVPDAAEGIVLRWCTTRLARNPALAGLKTLNRLEQVLAQAEWHESQIAEGLMLDTEGELVSATAANVFIVRQGVLVTPDLRFCGIRGVMRARVLRAAEALGLAVSEEPLWPDDVDAASEVFLTNAVRGIRPVAALEQLRWPAPGPFAGRIAAALDA